MLSTAIAKCRRSWGTRRPSFIHSQPTAGKRNPRIAGFVSAETPHSNPDFSAKLFVSDRSFSTETNTRLNRKADRLVSQTRRTSQIGRASCRERGEHVVGP